MLAQIIERFSRRSKSNGREIPIYLFTYHKVATVLMHKIFRDISSEYGWKYKRVFGKCTELPETADVVLFMHSLVDLDLVSDPYVGAHFIRDPRDVIVSGYLYHKRCDEEWCLNTNFDASEPISYPRVPYSQEHRTEGWKRRYLVSLGNKSYQQNLNDLTDSEGILFEMDRYGAWTIENMLSWNYHNPNVEEVQFETIMSNYDETFRNLFERFGLSDSQTSQALRIAKKEDLNRMTDEEVQDNLHISTRSTTRWQKYFTEVHKEAFKQRFGEALIKLGYESSNDW